VREFSAEDDKRVSVILDTRMPIELRSGFKLRDVIEAEQKGKNIVRPERFEDGVRYAAALLSYFTKEQAEVRMVIDGEAGDFGVGSRHLHDSLKRLAVVEPNFVNEPNGNFVSVLAEIVNSDEKSHNFLVSAATESTLNGDILRQTQVIGY